MDEKDLEKLSIFELRDLARKVGVFNPTVLKKNQLISSICDIQTGKAKPHISKTKQGRPPKEICGYDKLVEIFLPNDLANIPSREESIFTREDKQILFNSSPSPEEESSKQVTFKGLLEILDNGSAVLRPRTLKSYESKDLVFVTNRNVVNLNLKGGDEIVCKANVIRNDKAMVMIEPIEINEIPFNEYSIERVDFEQNPCDLTKRNIDINLASKDSKNSFDLKYGDTIFVYPEKEDDFNLFISKFTNENSEQFDNVIYLAPIMTAQGYERLKSTRAEVFATDFNNTLSMQRKTAFLAYNRARRLAESGKNVCFVIDHIVSLLALDKDLLGDMLITKTIVSTAKSFAKGSLTVILSVPPIPQKNVNSLVYSTFPVIETVGLVLKNSNIDLKQSYRK